MGVDDEGPKNRQKKKKMAKQISFPKDEEEEGYMKRINPAPSVWYPPVIDRLRALFGNPEDAKLISWYASADRIKGDGKLQHLSDGKQWRVSMPSSQRSLVTRRGVTGSH